MFQASTPLHDEQEAMQQAVYVGSTLLGIHGLMVLHVPSFAIISCTCLVPLHIWAPNNVTHA